MTLGRLFDVFMPHASRFCPGGSRSARAAYWLILSVRAPVRPSGLSCRPGAVGQWRARVTPKQKAPVPGRRMPSVPVSRYPSHFGGAWTSIGLRRFASDQEKLRRCDDVLRRDRRVPMERPGDEFTHARSEAGSDRCVGRGGGLSVVSRSVWPWMGSLASPRGTSDLVGPGEPEYAVTSPTPDPGSRACVGERWAS